MVVRNEVLPRRMAGILLHPTSLPGAWEYGHLGPHARRFVDFLVRAGQGVWQILPLGPTHDNRSPYQCLSVHAGNPRLISIEELVAAGWLPAEAAHGGDQAHHERLLREAYRAFRTHGTEAQHHAMERFCAEEASWLDDYALYQAVRLEQQAKGWMQWPVPLRDREPQALAEARARLARDVEQARFEQWVFFTQWDAVKRYANDNGILVFGDVPIFVAHDSADVWAQREYFALDDEGNAARVAGVPPDYFSKTGQRWGNPHYRWDRMEQDGFAWWRERLRTQLRQFDLVRIDHFRGFEAYWDIPGEAETAVDGHWVKAPGEALFEELHKHFDPLPLVAEDLGLITDEVRALRDQFQLPGMTILQFAFDGGPENPYLPHNYRPNCVAYTGTHDNDTTMGWYAELGEDEQAAIHEYLGRPEEPMPWPLIRAVTASVARLAVVPLQDVLELGSEQRMNTPGTSEGNWRWRFRWEDGVEDKAGHLLHLAGLYGRLPPRD
ncbi:4-alpha-glucanotransferase [Ectothiorhodospiraceae bacterium 2226]|nr:4-alpha-glucanotransferase [Ectothiorhodospiraceae bacterium 2226]